AVVQVLVKMLDQPFAARHDDRPGEVLRLLLPLVGVDFDRSKQPRVLLAELTKPRVIGEDDRSLSRVQYTNRVQKRGSYDRRGGQLRARLILSDPVGEGLLHEIGKGSRQLLIDRAEVVLAAVACFEAEGPSLLVAARAHGSEPAGEAGQVEHGRG